MISLANGKLQAACHLDRQHKISIALGRNSHELRYVDTL